MLDKICADIYQKGYSVYDEFISADGVRLLLSEIEKSRDSFQKAGIGNKSHYTINEGVRGDFIKWIDEQNSAVFEEVYFNKLKPLIDSFNQRFFLGISQNEHHMAWYPAGTHYEKHVDTFKNTDARVISSVLYLNQNWKKCDGGELVIYPENEAPQTIEPVAGRIVLFESIIPHEVLTSNAPRYSITGWFKRNTVL